MGIMLVSAITTFIGGFLILFFTLISLIVPIDPISILGFIPGLMVVVGSYMIYRGSIKSIRIGGVVAIVFGVLSILVGGGFIIGLFLSVVGGSLALVFSLRRS